MAEEPQPSNIEEGATTHAPTGTVEDRKAAAALSSLDERGDDVEDDAKTQGKSVDLEALGQAMKRLEFTEKGKAGAPAPGAGAGTAGGAAAKKAKDAAAEKKAAVKVDQADVGLLVRTLLAVSSPLVHASNDFARTSIADGIDTLGRPPGATQDKGNRVAKVARGRCGEGYEGLYPSLGLMEHGKP